MVLKHVGARLGACLSLVINLSGTGRLIGERVPRTQRRETTLGGRSDLELIKPNFFLFFEYLDKVGGSC